MNSFRRVDCLSGLMGDRGDDSPSEGAWPVPYQFAVWMHGRYVGMHARALRVTCACACT